MQGNKTDERKTETSVVGPYLVLNEKDALVMTPSELSHALHDHFRVNGVSCSLVKGSGSRDLIDLGNPSAEEEKHIRSVFSSWRERKSGRSVESVWYVWLALIVVGLWLVMLLFR